MAAMRYFREIIECKPTDLGSYRYLLRVRLGPGRRLAVILKNPSTADALRSDPTVGKVEAWARRRGFGVVTYANLFAYRSPYPAQLNKVSYAAAVGPANDAVLVQAVTDADVAVLAWGNPNGIIHSRYQQRIGEVLAVLASTPPPPIRRVGMLTPRPAIHAMAYTGTGQRICPYISR
jgi:hypothetical protein